MEHPYEYQLMVKFLWPAQISGMPDLSQEKSQVQLMAELGKVARDLPQLINKAPGGDGWEINSHSITFVKDTVFISVLLQRPRT